MELNNGHFESGSDSIFGFIMTVTILMLGIMALEWYLTENMNLTVGLSYSTQGVLQRRVQTVIGNTLKVDLTD